MPTWLTWKRQSRKPSKTKRSWRKRRYNFLIFSATYLVPQDKYNDPGEWKWWVKQSSLPGGYLSTLVVNAHQKVVDKLADAKSDKSKVYNCRKYVISLSSQFNSLLPHMTAAIAALNSLALIFNSQFRNMELLIDSFQRIEKGTRSTVSAVRRSNIRSGIKYAIEDPDCS